MHDIDLMYLGSKYHLLIARCRSIQLCVNHDKTVSDRTSSKMEAKRYCVICKESFSKQAYSYHIEKKHNKRFFICPNYDKCGKSFFTDKRLKTHIAKFHPSTTDRSTQTLARENTGEWLCTKCHRYTSILYNDKNEAFVNHTCVDTLIVLPTDATAKNLETAMAVEDADTDDAQSWMEDELTEEPNDQHMIEGKK